MHAALLCCGQPPGLPRPLSKLNNTVAPSSPACHVHQRVTCLQASYPAAPSQQYSVPSTTSPFSTSKVSSSVSSVACLACALVGDSPCASSGISRPRVYHSGTSTCTARRRMSGAVADLVSLCLCCTIIDADAGLPSCHEQLLLDAGGSGVGRSKKAAPCAGSRPDEVGICPLTLLCTDHCLERRWLRRSQRAAPCRAAPVSTLTWPLRALRCIM